MFGEAKHLFLVRVLFIRKLTLPKTNITIEREKEDVAPMKKWWMFRCHVSFREGRFMASVLVNI